eukprot:TRINITY_DN328_c5_g1_i2.p1 TRINITY_DN328_c5_g1~~TRINITY_DN328_c5_g1_i2.p1  ORF type:complete len:560 (+),score=145.74 TRINITY_DN328_c5_g1_i2:141-1682(+)
MTPHKAVVTPHGKTATSKTLALKVPYTTGKQFRVMGATQEVSRTPSKFPAKPPCKVSEQKTTEISEPATAGATTATTAVLREGATTAVVSRESTTTAVLRASAIARESARNVAYTTAREILNECKQALQLPDVHQAHIVFATLYRTNPYVLDKAFFWLNWIQLHEKNGEFEMAAELYEQAFQHRAKPFKALESSLQRSLLRHKESGRAPRRTEPTSMDRIAKANAALTQNVSSSKKPNPVVSEQRAKETESSASGSHNMYTPQRSNQRPSIPEETSILPKRITFEVEVESTDSDSDVLGSASEEENTEMQEERKEDEEGEGEERKEEATNSSPTTTTTTVTKHFLDDDDYEEDMVTEQEEFEVNVASKPSSSAILEVLAYLQKEGYGGKTVDEVLGSLSANETLPLPDQPASVPQEKTENVQVEEEEWTENKEEFEQTLRDLMDLSINENETRRFSFFPVHHSLAQSYSRISEFSGYGTKYVEPSDVSTRTPISTPVRRSKRLATKTPNNKGQ